MEQLQYIQAFETSFSQQWVEKKIRARNGELPAVNGLCRLPAGWNKMTLIRLLEEKMSEYEIFRTTFSFHRNNLVQHIGDKPTHLALNSLVFRDLSAVGEWMDALPLFTLGADPPVRVYHIDLEEREQRYWVISCSSLVMDSNTLGEFILLLMAPPAIPQKAPTQFVDFATGWNDAWPAVRRKECQQVWKDTYHSGRGWGKRNEDDRPIRPTPCESVSTLLPPALWEKTTAFTTTHGGSPEVLFLTAYLLVLARYAREEDLSICLHHKVPVQEKIMGNLDNILLIRRFIEESESFSDFYKGMVGYHRKVMDAAWPFELVSAALEEDNAAGHTTDYGYAFHDYSSDALLRVVHKIDQHRLHLDVAHYSRDTVLTMEYDPAIYTREEVTTVLRSIGPSLDKLLADPGDTIAGITTEPLPNPLRTLGRKTEDHNGFSRLSVSRLTAQLKNYPGIKQVTILATPDTGWVCFYACVSGSPNEFDLLTFLQESNPLKNLPLQFVRRDHLPLTDTGAIDTDTLLAEYQPSSDLPVTGPRDDIERRLSEIWSHAIGITSDIGIGQNFFTLGGNSLKALKVISDIYEAFDVQLELRSVYDSWTIEKLAGFIRSAKDNNRGGLIEAPITGMTATADGIYDASYIQTRLWGVSQTRAASRAYTIRQVYQLYDYMDIDLLKTALSQLVDNYEILRTVFLRQDQEVRLKVLDVIDMDKVFYSVDRDENSQGAPAEYLYQLPVTDFDLEQGPLFDFKFLDLQTSGRFILFTIHHIVSDYWSVMIIFDRLRNIYNGLKKDLTYRLAPPRLQYKDFCAWQQRLLKDKFDYFTGYWKDRLKDCPLNPRIPYDFPKPFAKSYRGKEYNVVLDTDKAEKLREISLAGKASMLMTIFTVFNLAIRKHANVSTTVVIVHFAGRDIEQFKDQMGLFVNTVPVVSEFHDEEGFEEALARTREDIVRSYELQYFPLDILIRELDIKWIPGSLPISDIGFNWLYFSTDLKEGEVELGEPIQMKETGSAKFDLQLTGVERGSGVELAIEYNTDVYADSTIALFTQDMLTIIDRVLQDLRPIRDLIAEDGFLSEDFTF